MPVKVTVVDEGALRDLPSHEVEIPDKCPHCGSDLTGGSAVQEAGFVYYSSSGWIEKADPAHGRTEDDLDFSGSFEEHFDAGTIHTGYLCNACDGILA